VTIIFHFYVNRLVDRFWIANQIVGALANENGGLAVLESCGRHSFFLERLEKGAIMMRADTLGGINASSQSKP
jgi:hypothetical protein